MQNAIQAFIQRLSAAQYFILLHKTMKQSEMQKYHTDSQTRKKPDYCDLQ